MTPVPLHRPFIGISLLKEDYVKVRGLLPTPSYKAPLRSRTTEKQVILFAIDGYITSAKQFKWLSDLKLSLKELIFVPYDEVTEFWITERTEVTGVLYSLQELRDAFNVVYRQYPTIYFPPDKKSLYRHLIIHGKKLRYAKVFTREALTSSALMMNAALKEKLPYKELHKKSEAAYRYILENIKQFPERLSSHALKVAHSKGGKIRKAKQAADTKKMIDAAISTGDYTKPNGKVNKTLLAKVLGIHRRTLDRYL
jgi:hypothetical protein